jgi:hypothetical protein
MIAVRPISCHDNQDTVIKSCGLRVKVGLLAV